MYRFEKFSGNFWEKSGYLWYMEEMIKKILREETLANKPIDDDDMTLLLLKEASKNLRESLRYLESAIQYSHNLDGGSEMAMELAEIAEDIAYGSIPGIESPDHSCDILGRLIEVIKKYK